ncbi:MAG: hypothetical protein CM15mP92_1930 [Halieaceae bacterium]|nr:MAG: hypothetical protein CM15mP92_1930 [Halieaceae bacterium]
MSLSSAQPDQLSTQSGCKISAPALVSDTLGRCFFSETKLRSSAVARLQCRQIGDGARWIPPELELQDFGELPEGGHGVYSAPS